MKVITIGGATQDIFIQYEQQETVLLTDAHGQQHSMLVLEEGRKIDVDLLIYTTGGGSTNSAVSFVRLGLDASAFFKIGTDDQGDFILKELARHHINLAMVRRTDEAMTSVSFIIPSPSADRTVLVYRGAGTTIKHDDLPYSAFEQHDTVYISSLGGQSGALLPDITHYAKKKNVYVAVNPGSGQLQAGAQHVRHALPNIDVLILNEYEAQLLMNSLPESVRTVLPERTADSNVPHLLQATENSGFFNVRTFLRTILQKGPRIAIVTNGAEGVYVATQNKIFFHPSMTVPVVSTVGAGDAFASCFVALLRQGESIEQATRGGVINSASVISYVDAKTGLLTLDVVRERIGQIDSTLLRVFSL